ncbi:MAG: NAD kinase [Prevotella sp.]|nr:NAD kinase [Prevotella sp.]
MNKDKIRFAIFGNEYQAKKSQAVFKIIAILQRYEAEIMVDKPFYEFITQGQHMDVKVDGVFEDDDFDADFAVSMGGDGTLLKTASRVGAKKIPVIGVNIGRLGFLADVNPSEIETSIAAVFEGKYSVYEHSVIKIETEEGGKVTGSPYALNDIAVLKRDHASMISIRASINDEYVMTYQADGLIVTTPTGSTAYSLSNGGPIIAPGTGTLCLTAVAPHSLNVRPIVVPDTSVITLKVESRSHSFLAAVDGRSSSLHDGTVVHISKAPYSVRIVRFSGRHYFATLREKMMWGMDQR